MGKVMYKMVDIIADIHRYILSINDSNQIGLTDKQLHFIVIGILGMLMLFVVYPVFKWLSEKHVMVIAWIYVFTLLLVITFAIEIGQKLTNTGNMEFADVMFGLVGFLIMFTIFSVIRSIYHLILDCIDKYMK
ncbi:small membrane protein [Lachnospiraceae bacterium KM106-2]|nr:small membrane protein [Lachnospiraceae bacterium KM106-2]